MLESIKSDCIIFGGMEVMGEIIIGLSIFILGTKIIKDIYNMETLSNYKFRKREIIDRVINYIIFLIDTVITTRQQKKIMQERRLNPNNWLVLKNPTSELHIQHRESKKIKILSI